MSITTPDTESGEPAVNNIVPEPDTKSNPSIEALVMTLALQKKEWQDLRGTSGVILRMDNYRDPPSGRSFLLLAFGLDEGEVQGNDATGEIFVNGRSIDDLLPEIVERNRSATVEVEDGTDEKTT